MEMQRDQIPEIAMVRWLNPIAPAPELQLKPGEQVKVVLHHPNDSGEVAVANAKVLSLSRFQDFPQEVKLDVPH